VRRIYNRPEPETVDAMLIEDLPHPLLKHDPEAPNWLTDPVGRACTRLSPFEGSM
jgi:hypothetical protein